jgi:hypothetical protein
MRPVLACLLLVCLTGCVVVRPVRVGCEYVPGHYTWLGRWVPPHCR